MPAQRHLVATNAELSLGADQPQGEKATFAGHVVRNRQKPGWTFSLRSSIQSPEAIFQKNACSSSHPLATSWSRPVGGPATASTSSNVTLRDRHRGVHGLVLLSVFGLIRTTGSNSEPGHRRPPRSGGERSGRRHRRRPACLVCQEGASAGWSRLSTRTAPLGHADERRAGARRQRRWRGRRARPVDDR